MATSSSADHTSPASSKVDPSRSRCLFCKICDERDPNKIIYEDETIVAFPDIRPAAKYHFLIVPKEHIRDSKSLRGTEAHSHLLDRLVQIGKQILAEKVAAENVNEENKAAVTLASENVLMGFHWPPFHTVSHLHLHVIAPSDKIGFIERFIFRPNSYWFVSPEWLKSRLEKLKVNGES